MLSGAAAVVPLSLGAAVAFAASSALKHVSAGDVPDAQTLHLRGLGRLAAATLSHRYWLAGLGFDAVGLGLQAVALHLGELALVQPLLVTGLLFALLFRHRLHGDARLSRQQALWAGALCAALAGFLAVADIGGHSGGDVDRLPAVIAGVVGAVATVTCVELGRRQRGGEAAALMGVAVGVIYASTAALLKALTDIAAHGVAAVATSWQLYVFVALGGAGLLLNQVAFQAGPMTASLPAASTIDPLLSVVVGVAVYDEKVHTGPTGGFLLALLLVALGTAVFQLARLEAATTGSNVA